MSQLPPLLSVNDLCSLLGWKNKRLYKHVRDGCLSIGSLTVPVIRDGNRILFKAADLAPLLTPSATGAETQGPEPPLNVGAARAGKSKAKNSPVTSFKFNLGKGK